MNNGSINNYNIGSTSVPAFTQMRIGGPPLPSALQANIGASLTPAFLIYSGKTQYPVRMRFSVGSAAALSDFQLWTCLYDPFLPNASSVPTIADTSAFLQWKTATQIATVANAVIIPEVIGFTLPTTDQAAGSTFELMVDYAGIFIMLVQATGAAATTLNMTISGCRTV